MKTNVRRLMVTGLVIFTILMTPVTAFSQTNDDDHYCTYEVAEPIKIYNPTKDNPD